MVRPRFARYCRDAYDEPAALYHNTGPEWSHLGHLWRYVRKAHSGTGPSPHVVHALLATEDRRFYQHFGVDIVGLIRGFWANYRAGTVVQGGSTITQQLAKNILQAHGLYTPSDRSLRRKIQEAIMACWLEYRFNKQQILTLYLNRIYFGGGTFGIDELLCGIMGAVQKS